jgi:hypothetical protein
MICLRKYTFVASMGGRVGLAVLQQEVIELLLGLHLRAQLVDVDRL